jgi:hypothetical protein
LARSLLYQPINKIKKFTGEEFTYAGGYYLFWCYHFIFWPLRFVCQSLREVLAMLDIIVGLIGVVLIIYLLATVIRPELF